MQIHWTLYIIFLFSAAVAIAWNMHLLISLRYDDRKNTNVYI